MVRKQIATLLTEIAKEELGTEIIFAEDLSDVVDSGRTFLDVVSENAAFDSVLGAIINKVGKTIVVSREYEGGAPTLIRDSWEYGSILEKIRIKRPEPSVNNSWNLEKGTKYDDILVYDPPEVSANYYNKRATFNIKMSFPSEYQLRESFKSAGALNRFFAGIENRIRTAMRFDTQMMSQRTLNNLIALSAARRVKLVTKYNTARGTNLTAEQAVANADFLRFASMEVAMYSDYMERLSVSFNNGEYEAFSKKPDQHFVVLSAFARAVDVYSLSDTYHNEFVKLVQYETIPFWQGVADTDTDFDNLYNLNAVSKIDIYPSGVDSSEPENAVELNGVIGVLFDRDAAAICCENERVTSFYNAENDTTKYYYKYDVSYQNDPNENCVVFTLE